jgi:hypothetical protein
MIPLCIQLGDITEQHVERAAYVHRLLRDFDGIDRLSCHTACAKLVELLPDWFVHFRGFFADKWDHSWLVFKDSVKVILDPYPWACGSGPLLVTIEGFSPWRYLYQGLAVAQIDPQALKE